MERPNLDYIVGRSSDIASLPEVFNRINEAVNDPRVSMSQVSRIVSEDPGLATRILRLANSAFYALPRKVDTLSQAVVVLGTQQVRDLALATSVISLFRGVPEELVSMKGFWTHSIACAMAARALAASRRQSDIERFFVAGIVHDVGRLILLKELPELSREALCSAEENSELLSVSERKVIGFDHAQVGKKLLERWELPVSLTEAVGNHHQPRSSRQYPLETAIIHVADIISHALGLDGSGEKFVPALNPLAWDQIGLTLKALEETIHQVSQEVNEVAEIFLSDE